MIRDFHPLVFFYAFGFADDARRARRSGIVESCSDRGQRDHRRTIVLVALLLISGIQFTLFAMWFDME